MGNAGKLFKIVKESAEGTKVLSTHKFESYAQGAWLRAEHITSRNGEECELRLMDGEEVLRRMSFGGFEVAV